MPNIICQNSWRGVVEGRTDPAVQGCREIHTCSQEGSCYECQLQHRAILFEVQNSLNVELILQASAETPIQQETACKVNSYCAQEQVSCVRWCNSQQFNMLSVWWRQTKQPGCLFREDTEEEKGLFTFTSILLIGPILPRWAWWQLTVARRPETLLPSVGATK